MASFLRVVKDCLRYRFTVIATIACAILIGILWGANIGTVFPFVEVVFGGRSLPVWVDDEISQAEAKIRELDIELATRRAVVASGQRDEGDLALLETRRNAEQLALDSYRGIQPWIHRYLPRDAYWTLVLVVGVLLVGTLLKATLIAVSTVLTERLAQAGSIRLRKTAFNRALQLPMGELNRKGSSQLTSRLTFDLEQVTIGLRMVFGRSVREPLKIVACFLGAAYVCWRLLLVSFVIAPLFVALITRLNRSVKKANARALDDMSRIHGVVADSLRAIKQIRAFTAERLMRKKFDRASRTYLKRAIRVSMLDALIRPSIELMTIGVICVAVLAGGYLVLNEQTHLLGIRISNRPLSISSLLLFFGLLTGVSDPARKLSGVVAKLQRAAAAADRISLLSEPSGLVAEPKGSMADRADLAARLALPRPTLQAPLRGSIEFRDVEFSYEPGTPVLDRVGFSIGANETVAVVGPNGCGKSTLMQLLLRFHDPTSGDVIVDGSPIQSWQRRSLRRQIGLVTQDSVMIDDTVAANIRLGKPTASHDDVVAAARQARAHEFITGQLAYGYDTPVGELASQLSGGQRQRLALARAILREPRILILDEATSQIDLDSERQIHEALRDFVRDRTTLIITHQLSVLEIVDRILVMDQGRVVDSGTYPALLSRCQVFQRLVNAGLKQTA